VTDSTDVQFVGIDAHQDSLSIAVLTGDTDQPLPVRTLPNRPSRIRAYFRQLLASGPVSAVYEAGCLGFVLYRQLVALGVECTVAAPSLIPKLPGDRRKTDRLDARRLAIFLRGKQLTAVSPPTPQVEALRAVTRTRFAMRQDVVRAKHRVQKFVVLRGKIFPGKANWTQAHWRWLRAVRLELEDDQHTLEFLIAELEHRLDSLKSLDDRIALIAQREELSTPVSALRAFKGVATTTAVSVLAEVGDPRRFANARQVASFVGLVPSEHSSGTQVHRGPITRTGNPRLRRLLVEAAQHYSKSSGPGHARRTRRKEAPPQAVELARKADRRLATRFRAVAARKHTNVAKCAVARELVGFLWQALLDQQKTA
jgi:transposase